MIYIKDFIIRLGVSMKKFIFLVMMCMSVVLQAKTKEEMTRFYDEFVCNEKKALHFAGLGPSCTFIPFIRTIRTRLRIQVLLSFFLGIYLW